MGVVIDFVVHDNWAVYQPPHVTAITNSAPHSWITSEQIQIIKKGVPKAGSRAWIILRNISDNLREIGLSLFACKRGGNPLGQARTNFFCGHSSTSPGISDAFVNCGQRF